MDSFLFQLSEKNTGFTLFRPTYNRFFGLEYKKVHEKG